MEEAILWVLAGQVWLGGWTWAINFDLTGRESAFDMIMSFLFWPALAVSRGLTKLVGKTSN